MPVLKYFDYGDSSVQVAGIRMIPIQTPVDTFHVWAKRFGNNPRIKILLLPGGPAFTHEYMECFESFFPKESFVLYEYDQLGSYYSDQPTDSSLWTIAHFVDEVEQVRRAIGAKFDTMDPKVMERQSHLVKHGSYLYCPNDSHLAMWTIKNFL